MLIRSKKENNIQLVPINLTNQSYNLTKIIKSGGKAKRKKKNMSIITVTKWD